MDSWPTELQQKLNSTGFELQFGNTLVRSDMDVGPAKVRSRFTDAVDTYQCQITIDHDELSILRTFFKTTLNNGANRFLFNDPFTETATEFRFAQPPSIRPLGGRVYEVSMLWEKLSLGTDEALETEGVWPLISRTYGYTDISDPLTTTQVVVRTLPFDRVLNFLIGVVTEQFDGPGLSSLKLDIGIAGDTTKFINGLDLMAAAGEQDSIVTAYYPGANTSIVATITAIGCNLEDLTAGEFKIHIGESEVES